MAFLQIGNEFGKTDLERLGIFSEMPSMNGKGYVSPFPKPAHFKGKNIIGPGPKTKRAKTDCYFDKEFRRIFAGEAYKGRGKKPKPVIFKKVSNSPFAPPKSFKPICTKGEYVGCFSGNIEYFSNKRKPQPPFRHESKNCVTKPGKQGGPGDVDICINKYPEHSTDRYGLQPKFKSFGAVLNGPFVSSHYPSAYFEKNPYPDPPTMKPGHVYVKPKEKPANILPPGYIVPIGKNKLPGQECFNKFTEHGEKPDKYVSTYDILEKPRKLEGSCWYPQPTTDRTMFTTSILKNDCRFKVNHQSYRDFKPTYIKYLVD